MKQEFGAAFKPRTLEVGEVTTRRNNSLVPRVGLRERKKFFISSKDLILAAADTLHRHHQGIFSGQSFVTDDYCCSLHSVFPAGKSL